MHVKHLAATQREEWNAFAAQEPSFALLQSWEWGEFKEKLRWQVFRVAVQEQGRIVAGAQMLIKPLPSKLASVAYIPRGPIGKWLDQRVASLLLSELHRVARLHRAIFLKIEPPLLYDPALDQTLQQYHFQPSSYANQPRATIILDLQQSLDDILLQMRRRTREYIKYSVRKGVSVRTGGRDNLPGFCNLMHLTGRRGHFPARSRRYYEQEWQAFADDKQKALLMAAYQDQLLAVHMAFRFGDRAAYFHGGSSNDHTALRPNYLLMWEAIKWAKEQGCRAYDLWGIPDEVGQAASGGKELPAPDRTDGLWGVYQFKSGFSKNIVYYMGAYDYAYSPLLYTLITNKYFNLERTDRFSVMLDSFTRA